MKFELIRYAKEGFYPHPLRSEDKFYNIEKREFEHPKNGCFAFFEQVDMDALTNEQAYRRHEKVNRVWINGSFELYCTDYAISGDTYKLVPDGVRWVRTTANQLFEWLLAKNDPSDFVFLQVYLSEEMLQKIEKTIRNY